MLFQFHKSKPTCQSPQVAICCGCDLHVLRGTKNCSFSTCLSKPIFPVGHFPKLIGFNFSVVDCVIIYIFDDHAHYHNHMNGILVPRGPTAINDMIIQHTYLSDVLQYRIIYIYKTCLFSSNSVTFLVFMQSEDK